MAGEINFLEVFRYYRSIKYTNINDFYSIFFKQAKKILGDNYQKEHTKCETRNYLKHFVFYSDEDRWFRYLRDYPLKGEPYKNIMLRLMKKDNISPESCCKLLWMSKDEVKALHEQGHFIGLHSYNHPTMMETLSKKEQEFEYSENFKHLQSITNSPPTSMSHPCGKYNSDTIGILESLGVIIGFRSDMVKIENANKYELPREDHTNIMRLIREELDS